MPAATEIIAPKRILRVPLRVYDISTKGYRDSELYVSNPKPTIGTWPEKMLEAQNSGRRSAISAEWFLGRRYLETNRPKEEQDFISGPLEWTGTVLDFSTGELLEGIELNPDGSIKTAKRLGKKEGVVLPDKSAYVRDLGEEYMPLAQHLWGLEDPKRELPDYTCLWISPGFRPVVRGGWAHRHDLRRMDVGADYEASDGRFASRFVSDARPDNLITPEQYEIVRGEAVRKRDLLEKERAEMEKRFASELKPLEDKLNELVVLVE